MNNYNNTRKIVILSLLLSISIVLSIIESLIPIGIPGIKLGFANVITLIIIYIYTPKEALLVLTLRIIIVGILRGNILTAPFLMGIFGSYLSLIIMSISRYIFKEYISLVGISILGSFFYGIGEIFIAIFIFNTLGIIYYLPLILILSIPTGFITGYLSLIVVNNKNIKEII